MLYNRVCRSCGVAFKGGPRAWYCPDCRAERKRQQMNEYHERKRSGNVREIGSTSICESCGSPYVVVGSLQRYCRECSEKIIAENDRKQGLEYYHNNKDWINPARNESRRITEKFCERCGKPILVNGPSKYCNECRKIVISEQRRLVMKKWNAGNRDKINTRANKYRIEHLEEVRKYQREWVREWRKNKNMPAD